MNLDDDRFSDDDEDEPDTPAARLTRIQYTPHTCHHTCACGAELYCGDADRCRERDTAKEPWRCPTCVQIDDLQALDEYFNRVEAARDRRT